MQVFTEFFPIIAFFIAGQIYSFEEAVMVLLIATIFSLAVAWLHHRRIPIMPLASSVLVLITGTLTIYFNKPDAIILGDTIWFWGLAILIIVCFRKQPHLLERMFGRAFAISRTGWTQLSWRWLVVLILAGAANEYVRIMMTPEFWIDYRFVKILLIMVFSLYQFTLARKYRIEGESNSWGVRTKE